MSGSWEAEAEVGMEAVESLPLFAGVASLTCGPLVTYEHSLVVSE